MAMNHDVYTYKELGGRKNVLCQIQNALASSLSLDAQELAPELVPFVDELVKVKPHWKFVACRQGGTIRNHDGTLKRRWHYLEIYENNEHIGEIECTYSYRNHENVVVYCYDNHRLTDKRKRGGWTKSANLNKAVKGVLKAFRPRDVTEQVRDRMSYVERVIPNIVDAKRREFNVAFVNIRKEAHNFVMRNWESLKPLLDESGITYLKNIPELYESMELAEMLLSDSTTLTITVRPTDYIVVRSDGAERTHQIVTSEELPDMVRAKLGMLKLTEIKQYIPNVGVRCTHDTYFITLGDNK